MRTFLTTLLAVTCIFWWAVSFGAAGDESQTQQKMQQLKQLLAAASQSSSGDISQSMVTTQNVSQLPAVTTPVAATISTGNVSDSDQSNTNGLYDQAFSGVVSQLLPMTPSQIAKLRDVFTDTQKAAATPPGVPPKPTSTSLLVNLSPQAAPPVIRLGAGYITSLVFIDSTGQPWPIAAYSVGDPSSFNVQWDRKGNTLLVQSMTFYKRSNLAVILRDLNTPVMVTLISGQEAVDYRVDLRVPGIGPNAIYVQNGIPDATNPILFDVLNGVPPKGSKELKVSGGDCQAWLLENKLYLRTNLNITSPGWQSIMSSVDGTHAYQLQPSPVLLALKNGKDKIITLTLEGLE
jgi:intracellular multiplication protein IcmK